MIEPLAPPPFSIVFYFLLRNIFFINGIETCINGVKGLLPRVLKQIIMKSSEVFYFKPVSIQIRGQLFNGQEGGRRTFEVKVGAVGDGKCCSDVDDSHAIFVFRHNVQEHDSSIIKNDFGLGHTFQGDQTTNGWHKASKMPFLTIKLKSLAAQ